MFGFINKAILIGNLGKIPELRFTQDGKKVVTFPLATSEFWQDKATKERKDKIEWHQIVIYNERYGEIAMKNLKKGSKVYIEGQVHTRKCKDHQGHERFKTEIVLHPFRGELALLETDDEILSQGPMVPNEKFQEIDLLSFAESPSEQLRGNVTTDLK